MLVQITLESAVGSGEGEGSWLIVAISFCAKELGGWGSHLCAEEGRTGAGTGWHLGCRARVAPAYALLSPAWSLRMEMIQLKGWEMGPPVLERGV